MHYVYELRDPATGVAFYVGKGTGDRCYQHQREVINGTAKSNPAKIAKIKAILDRGEQVEVAIIAEYDCEEDALDHEYHRIDADPTLTNVFPGGSASGTSCPVRRAASRHEAAKKLMSDLNKLKASHEKRLRLGEVERAANNVLGRKGLPARHADEIKHFVEQMGSRRIASKKGWKALRDRKAVSDDKYKSLLARIEAAAVLVEETLTALTKERRLAQVKRASFVTPHPTGSSPASTAAHASAT